MPLCAHIKGLGWGMGLPPTSHKMSSRILDGSATPSTRQVPAVNTHSAACGNVIHHKGEMPPPVRDSLGFSPIFSYKLGVVLL